MGALVTARDGDGDTNLNYGIDGNLLEQEVELGRSSRTIFVKLGYAWLL